MSSSVWDESPDPRTELAALIEAGLGHPLTDPKKFQRLVDMQTKLHAEQDALSRMLVSGEITPEEYISRLGGAMAEAAIVGRDELGRKNFEKVFGDFRVEEIIDVPAFIGAHGHAAG